MDMLSWSSETAAAACMQGHTQIDMEQEWTKNSAGLPKQVADEQAAHRVLFVTVKHCHLVKLTDLAQNVLEVPLKQGPGRSCRRRGRRYSQVDLLSSLAIRLEQCQGLLQILLVLLVQGEGRWARAASSWVAAHGGGRRHEVQVVALYKVLELRVDLLVHVCATFARSLAVYPLLVGHLDLLHAEQEKTKQRTKRTKHRTGLENVVGGVALSDLPHFTGLQGLLQPLLATTGNPGSGQGVAQGLVLALDTVELFVSFLPPGVLQAQLEASSLTRRFTASVVS